MPIAPKEKWLGISWGLYLVWQFTPQTACATSQIDGMLVAAEWRFESAMNLHEIIPPRSFSPGAA